MSEKFSSENSEQFQVSMEEFDAQAVQSQQMDNDESVDNGTDNDTGKIDIDGGIDTE